MNNLSCRLSVGLFVRNALGFVFCSFAGIAVASGSASTASSAANPQRQLLAALTDLATKQPRHVGAAYVAARTAAALGDEQTAFYWLDRLAEIGLGDEIDPDDFGPLALTPGFIERAIRFAEKAPPIGSAAQVLELQCGNLLPEGTAFDSKREELLISSGRRRTIVAVDARGRCRDVVPEGDGTLFAVLGMYADPSNDTLWVASAAAPFMINATPAEAGGSILARIDLARGRVIASYRLACSGQLNDLSRGKDGSVYVTESRGGTIYVLRPTHNELQPLFPQDTFESPNGILVLPDGNLLVADFDGLALILDPSATEPRVQRLNTPDDLYLGGIDGLAWSEGRVVPFKILLAVVESGHFPLTQKVAVRQDSLQLGIGDKPE